MGEIINSFEQRRNQQLEEERNKRTAGRAVLLEQLEYWAEKESDSYRAYEYAREKRERIALKLGLFVMPGRIDHNIPKDNDET